MSSHLGRRGEIDPTAGRNFHRKKWAVEDRLRPRSEEELEAGRRIVEQLDNGVRVDVARLEQVHARWLRRQAPDHPWRVAAGGGEA